MVAIERLVCGERRQARFAAEVALGQRRAVVGEVALGREQRDPPATAFLAVRLDRARSRQAATGDHELERLHRIPPPDVPRAPLRPIFLSH
jgi:hypothetical protein